MNVSKSKPGISRPYSLGTYAKLMIGTVILIGLNSPSQNSSTKCTALWTLKHS